MELLQFEITNAGTLGSRWTPPAPKTKKASSLPGAALAALLQEEDDEDDWGGDAPDMSAEFARLDATFPQLIHDTAQQTRFSTTANAGDHLDESRIVIERTKLG